VEGHEASGARPRAPRGAGALQHKNLAPVAYVTGDLAGEIESPLYALLALEKKLGGLRGDAGELVPRLGLSQPSDGEHPTIKWDGEWHITLEVFRDLFGD
jgi:hypothetical protein